jgi:hypothetical protein
LFDRHEARHHSKELPRWLSTTIIRRAWLKMNSAELFYGPHSAHSVRIDPAKWYARTALLAATCSNRYLRFLGGAHLLGLHLM